MNRRKRARDSDEAGRRGMSAIGIGRRPIERPTWRGVSDAGPDRSSVKDGGAVRKPPNHEPAGAQARRYGDFGAVQATR